MTGFESGLELPSDGADDAFVQQLMDAMVSRTKSVLAMYRVHRDSGTLDQYRMVTYRCPRRCLLLDVYQTPGGPAVYFPPFELSAEETKPTGTGGADRAHE